MKKNLILIVAKDKDDVCTGCVFNDNESGCMEEEDTKLYSYPKVDPGCWNEEEQLDYIYVVSLVKILKKL